MLPMSATGRGGPADERRGTPTRFAAVGISLSAHAAAIGALLMLKPAPFLATPPEAIEVTVVIEEALASSQANNLSADMPRDASVDSPAAPLVSLTHPDVIPTAPSPDWFQGAKSGRSFDVAPLPAFGLQMRVPAFDTLAAEVDCLAVRGAAPGPLKRSRRDHPPCLSDDSPPRASVAALLPPYSSRPSERVTDHDYRNFADEIATANGSFETWIRQFLH